MSSATAVLLCVLQMLGRKSDAALAVEFVDVRPANVSATAEGFVDRASGTIYIVTSTKTFRAAQFGDLLSLKKIASIYAHEEWHLGHGNDERGAYQAQMTALTQLGVGPGTSVYYGVVRAMQQVLKAQRAAKAPPTLVAGTFDRLP